MRFQPVFAGLLLLSACSSATGTSSPVATTSTTRAPASRTDPSVESAPPTSLAYHSWITVKYRDTPVDLAAPGMIQLPVVADGDVVSVYWDSLNDYMVINLTGTWYHYCAFAMADAEAFVAAPSGGSHYQSVIRGTHDCRTVGTIPAYGAIATGDGSYYGSDDATFDEEQEREQRIEDAEYDLGRPLDEEADADLLDAIDQEVDDMERQYEADSDEDWNEE